jgi:general secretion pathway protein G
VTWVAKVVALFREGEGRLPADLAELFQHRLPTGRSDDPANDLHGRPLRYEASPDGKTFAIRSLGKDGKPGGRGPDADVEARAP